MVTQLWYGVGWVVTIVNFSTGGPEWFESANLLMCSVATFLVKSGTKNILFPCTP